MIYMQQDTMIYHASKYSGALKLDGLKPNFDLLELEFETSDGMQSALLMTPPKGNLERIYAVFGGNAMLARHWLGVLPTLTLPLKNTAFVLVDYPGYGNSAGQPSVASIERGASAALYEAAQALSDRIDEDVRYGAIGHSIGCAAAMHLAVVQRQTELRIGHLILSAPFVSLPAAAQAMLPVLKVFPRGLIAMLIPRQNWDNLLAARLLAGSSAPQVDIIHGKEDEIIPYEHGEELAAHLKSLGYSHSSFKSMDAGHNDIVSTSEWGTWVRESIEASNATPRAYADD